MNLNELTAAIDAVWAIDAELQRVKSEEALLVAERRGLELQIMAAMQENNASILAGNLARATLAPKVVYNVLSGMDGWPKLYARIQSTGEFDLLHKRLSLTAAAERFKAGDFLPGVERKEIPELKIKALT